MLDSIDPGWLWAIGGILLLIAEVLAPGFFLVFIGAAAVATGLFTVLFGLGLSAQLGLFAIYAIVAVLAGRRWYAQPAGPGADALLNEPAGRLIGRSAQAVTAIDEHGGRVRLGDSEWSARGGPAAPGDRVRIAAVEGNCLIVDRGTSLPPS
jgi:membrane protein implicated in regulation of membrane protease activity